MAAKSTPVRKKFGTTRGFKRADGLMQSRIRAASEGRGFAVSRLLTHWAEVAGAGLADHTRPVRITYGKGAIGATLTLLTTGAWAPMVQAELPKLRDRVNACYGYAAVARIRLTQTAPTGFAEGQADFQHSKPIAVKKEPDPEVLGAARDCANGISNKDLRVALETMGTQILSKPKH